MWELCAAIRPRKISLAGRKAKFRIRARWEWRTGNMIDREGITGSSLRDRRFTERFRLGAGGGDLREKNAAAWVKEKS